MNTDPQLAEALELNNQFLPANMKCARLEEFRQAAYKYLGRAKDATFELTDAILLTRNIYSLADLASDIVRLPSRCLRAIAFLTSTQVIRAMINELPEPRAEIARIQALPVSGTYRLTSALLCKK